jgi:hypothetical protein
MVEPAKGPLPDAPGRGLVGGGVHARHEIPHQLELGVPAPLLGVDDERSLDPHLGEPTVVGDCVVVPDMPHGTALQIGLHRLAERLAVAIRAMRAEPIEDRGLAHEILAPGMRDQVAVEEHVPAPVHHAPKQPPAPVPLRLGQAEGPGGEGRRVGLVGAPDRLGRGNDQRLRLRRRAVQRGEQGLRVLRELVGIPHPQPVARADRVGMAQRMGVFARKVVVRPQRFAEEGLVQLLRHDPRRPVAPPLQEARHARRHRTVEQHHQLMETRALHERDIGEDHPVELLEQREGGDAGHGGSSRTQGAGAVAGDSRTTPPISPSRRACSGVR